MLGKLRLCQRCSTCVCSYKTKGLLFGATNRKAGSGCVVRMAHVLAQRPESGSMVGVSVFGLMLGPHRRPVAGTCSIPLVINRSPRLFKLITRVCNGLINFHRPTCAGPTYC
jgi:hypothetical protein